MRARPPLLLALLAATAPTQDPDPENQPAPLPEELRTGPGRELTLEEAMELGLRFNVDLRSAELGPEQVLQDRIVAEAVYEPELYADVGVVRSQSQSRNVFQPSISRDSVDGTVGWRQRMLTGGLFDVSWSPTRISQSAGVSGFPSKQYITELRATYTQPLLRGGWIDYGLAQVDIARYRYASSRHDFGRTVQDVLFAIVEAYWELVFARENYRVGYQALEVAREQLRITNERIRVQELAERDRIADEAEVAVREEELIRAGATIEQREDELRRLLFDDRDGAMWRLHLHPVTPYEIEPEMLPDDSWREHARTALRERPDLQALRSDVAAAEQAVLRAQRDLWPQLDLVTSYATDGVRDQFHEAWRDATHLEFPDWSVGLEFVLPVGNSAARARHRQAGLELERTRRALYARELDVSQEVRQAVREVNTSAESIAASRESVRLAESNLETERIRLGVGATTTFEVQRRNQELREARSRLLRNLLDYRIALSALEYVRGTLDAEEAETP